MLTITLESFVDYDFTNCVLPLITVYNRPLDFPDKYVARLFDLDKATVYAIVKDNIEEIHESLPAGFTRMDRNKVDDPNIVEVWL